MKLTAAYLFWLLSWPVGCGARGVSLGAEEQCIKDEGLAIAELRTPGESVSSCATLGDNQLENSGFETPDVTARCMTAALYCQLPAAEVMGWSTTSEAQVIELWFDGYMNVPAPEGNQFGEINAQSRDTIQQDLALVPDQLMYWSLLHRGREGIDSLELRVGPPDALVTLATISSAEDAWYSYSGLYRVGKAEKLTRFSLVSRSGEARGNLIDALVFAPVQ